jgi:hypothetical protein
MRGARGDMKNAYKILAGRHRGKEHFGDSDVNDRIILK